jgi:hypothetical protein
MILAKLKSVFTLAIPAETGFGYIKPTPDAPVAVTITPFPGEVPFMAALKHCLNGCSRDEVAGAPLFGAITGSSSVKKLCVFAQKFTTRRSCTVAATPPSEGQPTAVKLMSCGRVVWCCIALIIQRCVELNG